ncbi:MAG: DUF411 domain-containing protein [Gammaproteobacteria bacterium]|nr:DUF411 domain-containing protein [Gammaproteobacteria bacterium]
MRRILALAIVVFSITAGVPVWADEPAITVYKSPTCGCCKKWVTHLEDNGFDVEAKNVRNVAPIKDENGVPRRMRSCHTAVVGGYVVEGHVPASDIKRMLKEQPNIRGLAVPGMPVGSPGMEQGSRKDPYPVVAFDKKGNLAVYNRYE